MEIIRLDGIHFYLLHVVKLNRYTSTVLQQKRHEYVLGKLFRVYSLLSFPLMTITNQGFPKISM